MNKKTIPFLIVAALIAAGTTAYFLFLKPVNVFVAIPNSAIAVIEVENWKALTEKLSATGAGAQLKKMDFVQRINTELATIDTMIMQDGTMKDMFGTNKMIASVHLVSAGDYDFLFSIPAKGWSDNSIIQHIQGLKNVRSVNLRVFKSQKLIDVVLNNGQQLTVTKLRGILSFSFTPFLTENAVSAIRSGTNLQTDKSFRRTENHFSEKADVFLYLNFAKSDVLLPIMVNDQKLALLQDIRDFASWGAYAINLNNDGIKINGAALATDKEAASEKNALENSLPSRIPDNAAYVKLDFNNWANATGDEKQFSAWTGEAHAFVVLEPTKADFTEQSIFITQITDRNLADKALHAIGVRVDTFHNTPVYQLKHSDIVNRVFGNTFVLFANSYAAVNNDVAIIANSEDVLKLAIEKINRGECLNKDAKFKTAIDAHLVDVNSFVYINPKRAGLLFEGLVRDNSMLPNYLGMFSSLIANNSRSGEWISSLVSMKAAEGQEEMTSGILWKTKLQTLSVYQPQVVRNVNTGEKEIFTQDTAGNIYLLSKAGDILFTKNTTEPIISNVYQLDYYNNGKLQYVFNSAHHIFIVDRFGNDVGSFPLRLSYPATVGMTFVADSSANTYRYYIPCSNGAIYGYESNGRPLAGWSPKGGTGTVEKPVQYIHNKTDSYLLVFSNESRLMLFDTKGALKWSVSDLPAAAQNFSVISTDSNFILLNAADKQLLEVSADGNDQMKPLVDSAYAFAAASTSDSTYVYFYSNHTQVRAYNEKGAFKNGTELHGAFISRIDIITVGDKKYLCVRDNAAAKVYLYDLQLGAVTDFSTKNFTSFYINNLFDTNRPIMLSSDSTGGISCIRM